VGDFLRAVRRIVRGIPRGTTLSYGEVALRAGKPRAARAVVSALHHLDDVPWWRVARHDGTLAPQVAREQATLLRQEGWKPRQKNRGHNTNSFSCAKPARKATTRRKR
jgi:methylated-DNA-protein-cysteine methyltransferase-like protein